MRRLGHWGGGSKWVTAMCAQSPSGMEEQAMWDDGWELWAPGRG